MRASVIIVAHQSAADLGPCLDALLPTLDRDDEVIVYDNASSDNGAAVARSRGVRVLRSDVNHGFGGANNRAVAEAGGRYLAFLNPDTLVEPGWLEELLAALGGASGLATSRIVLIDDPGHIDACGNDVHASGITTCRGHGRPAAAFDRDASILAVSGAAFAIDRASFWALGGFDERFFMYLEDTDLSLRAALAGLPIRYAARSVVRHRHVPSFSPRKLHWLERNRYSMLLKLWSSRTLLGLLPHLLLMESMTWAYAASRGGEGLRARASACAWLVRSAPAILRARREVQRRRRVSDSALLRRLSWRLDLTELVPDPRRRLMADAILLVPMALSQLWLRAVTGYNSDR